ncbi:MAG: ATP-independent RNA helicase DbpA [Gammaproteobacteria bacterium]
MTSSDFSSLPIQAELLSNIDSLGFKSMTPIQQQSLPALLKGQDLFGQAKTGSGKTAAFAIGILNRLQTQIYQTQALVLCPTRELADQVSNDIRRLARATPNTKVLTLCGGKPIREQYNSLESPPHIVIGTPGRISKHLEKGSLDLQQLTTFVLDEADRMLDMGFLEDIMLIIDQMPRKRQTVLFSATYPDEIAYVSDAIQNDPVKVQVESSHHNKQIKQTFYEIQKGERTRTLIAILEHFQPESALVFCNTKQQCGELKDELCERGFYASTIHGDLEQFERDQVLIQFSNRSTAILIATDVAARGLDIKELPAVINYELTHDPEIHIHRIGRTGRAGNEGLALSLFMPSEQFRVKAIEEYQGSPANIESPSVLKKKDNYKFKPPMVTIFINAGRKDKIRAGDILGALTGNTDLPGKLIGKIDILDKMAYVAVDRQIAKQALKILSEGKIKGRKFRVRKLSTNK